jgi:hypothetical protein
MIGVPLVVRKTLSSQMRARECMIKKANFESVYKLISLYSARINVLLRAVNSACWDVV